MINPELSVVIPAYNCDSYIGNCLKSVIKQVENHDIRCEIIVIDDGSTDDTAEIVRIYVEKYEYVKIIYQKNLKQAIARNNGIKLSKGKYILFIDADDILEDTMIIKLLEYAREGMFPICGIRKVYYGNKSVDIELPTITTSNNIGLKDYLTKNNETDVGLWNKMFDLTIIRNNNLYFENSNFFEDSLFVFDYLMKSSQDVMRIDEPLYSLYKRDSSTTTKFNSSIDCLSNQYIKKIEARCSKNKLFKIDVVTINTFKIRTIMHVVHHHIKYDPEWNAKKQKKFLSNSRLLKNIFYNRLSLRYKIAFIIMVVFPKGYICMYKEK